MAYYYGNFDGTLYDVFHNIFHRSVIAGIRLLVPLEQQRQEMSAPRLSDNGTNGRKGHPEQQRQEKSAPRLSYNNTNQQEQRSFWKDAVGNSPTNPNQFTNQLCG